MQRFNSEVAGGLMVAAGIKDVARLAGVSVATVSNVLNRPETVREATRRRVLAAMAELGFVPNESARQLRQGRSRTLAYVVFDPGNPFFADVARGAEDRARAAGLALYMCNSGEDAGREHQWLEILLEQRVRGVLITPIDRDGELLRSLPSLGVPVVLVDGAPGEPMSWCSVAVDDVEGGDLAVSHLLKLGHTSMAFVGGPSSLIHVADRLIGARRALARAALSEDRLTVLPTVGLTIPEGRRAGQHIVGMPSGHRPTAVFCANDLLALGLLQQLTSHGLHVPDEAAIVGYDDIEFAGAAVVPLTSVRQPCEEIGRRAADLLLAEADAHSAGAAAVTAHVHERFQLRPELIVRESSVQRRRHVRPRRPADDSQA